MGCNPAIGNLYCPGQPKDRLSSVANETRARREGGRRDGIRRDLPRSLSDPVGFWRDAARAIDWDVAPTRVLDDSNPPFYRWFPDGVLNSCHNALDRHVEQIVLNGWATAVRYEPDTSMAIYLEAAEASAHSQGLGIWGPNGGCVDEPAPSCDPAYPTVCIPPPPPDLDCGDIPHRRFTVLAPDPHRFDGDGDGIGCES